MSACVFVCVCVCVCVWLFVCKDISGTACAIFTEFYVHVACGRGSVLLRRPCDMLCTSDAVDGIMFCYSVPYIAVSYEFRYKGAISEARDDHFLHAVVYF